MSMPVQTAIFGPILSASEIEEAVTMALRQWFPTYLAEMERRLGMHKSAMPVPQNYTNRNSFDAVEGEKTPKIVVIAPGLQDEPTKNSSSYRAVWRLGIGIATGAKTEKECNRLVKGYAAAARAIMIHKPGTIADYGVPHLNEVIWLSEAYDDIEIPNQHRLYKAATLWFAMDINAVTARGFGPDIPDLLPGDYELVEDVIVDLENVPIGEEV